MTFSKVYQDYREILRSELALRFQKNPRYSLRAFARDLKLSSSRLSEIMTGKKGLSRESAHELAKRMSLNEQEQIFFCDLVEAEHARSPLARKEAKQRIKNTLKKSNGQAPENIYGLTLDSFRYIEDWYHVAILQYLKLQQKEKTPLAISRALGISIYEVESAIERMLRLELLEKKGTRLAPVHHWTMSGSGVPSRSVRKFHEQLIDRSKTALHLLNLDQRTFRSSVFSTELSRLPEIEEKIRLFTNQIIEQYSTVTASSEVVALTLQFFPLTKGSSEGENK